MHDGSRSRRDRDQKEIGREVKTSVKCNRKTENEQIRRESSKKQGDSRFYRSGQRAEPAGDGNCRAVFPEKCSGNVNRGIDLVSTQKYRKEEGRTTNHVR